MTSVLAQRPIGIDVSDYQSSSINWSTLKNTYGIVFGWAKATEGQSTSGGTNFPTYASNAKAAGVIIGAYDFARYDSNSGTNGAVAEANYFWNTIKSHMKADGLSLMPMLDMEWTNTAGYTQTTMSQWADTWCTTVSNNAYAAGLIVKPCIYCSSSYATTWFNSEVTKWNLDMAYWYFSYSSAESGAPAHSPWSTWEFWQYNDTNNAEAYTTGDGDVFNGTLAQLQATMVISNANLPLITLQTGNATIWAGSNATFSVTSTNATSYQWVFDGTNIPGATTSSYSITNAQATNAGAYWAVLRNSHGPINSSNMFLAVVSPLVNGSNAIVAPAGMADWWPADGNPNDIFGTANGTPSGGFYYSPGKSGEAFHFDGQSAYISTGAADIAPPWTACMWVNFSHTPQTSAGLLEDGTYSIKLEQYGSASHNVGISQLSYADSTFNYAAPTNQWVHLAFVANSSSVTLYANGVSQGSITTNNFPLPRAYMGAGYITSSAKFVDYMLGSLDELMIFKSTLSQAQIQAIYNAGGSGLVRAPEITGTLVNTNGQFVINLQGFTGKNYTIYESSDLTNWTSVGSLANASGTNSYTVANPTNNTQMFYRVSQTY